MSRDVFSPNPDEFGGTTPSPGQGVIWNGSEWVGADLANQSDLDTTQASLATTQTNLTTTQTSLSSHVGLTTTAHGGIVASNDSRLTNARTPTGAAGGVLSGTYPSPGFAVDMATQAELDAVTTDNDARYRQIVRVAVRGRPADIAGASTLLTTQSGALALVTATGNSWLALYLDPADYAIAGRTTKLRMRVACGVNATAPAITFTWGLYAATTIDGGVNVWNPNIGAAVTGSTIPFVNPTAGSSTQSNSGDFNFPAAAGFFVLGCAVSGAPAANSYCEFPIVLEVRNV